MDILFSGGTIVTDGLEITADLGITGGKISHWGANLKPEPETIRVDVDGRYLFPGAVEMLAGIEDLSIATSPEQIHLTTGLAALGGVTSLIIPTPPKRATRLEDHLESLQKGLSAASFTDFGFHLLLSNWGEESRRWIRSALGAGICSIWISPEENSNSPAALEELIWSAESEAGSEALIIVPLWDSVMASAISRNWIDTGAAAPTSGGAFSNLAPSGGTSGNPSGGVSGNPSGGASVGAASCGFNVPEWLEREALERFAGLAAAGHGRIIIRSISSHLAIEALKNAREDGVRIQAAAALPHLVAHLENTAPTNAPSPVSPSPIASSPTASSLAPSAAASLCPIPPCWPPIRSSGDQSALWYALEEGILSTITSCCGFPSGRLAPERTKDIRARAENFALMWSLLFTEGVLTNRLSLPSMVQSLCCDSAKLAGIYPRKGSLLIGSDADVVVFNPKISWIVGGAPEDRDPEIPPPEGPFVNWRLQGAIDQVYLSGQKIIDHGDMIIEPGVGRYLHRRLQIR